MKVIINNMTVHHEYVLLFLFNVCFSKRNINFVDNPKITSKSAVHVHVLYENGFTIKAFFTSPSKTTGFVNMKLVL